MIKYSVHCDHGHEFEGWYSSSDEFDAFKKAGQLMCAVCPSTKIEKSIMAPHIARADTPRTSSPEAGHHEALARHARAMSEYRELAREFIDKNFRDVGDKFAQHVREGDDMIKGNATPEDFDELLREGHPIMPIPPSKAELN